jgi:hypothetical protein
LGAADDWAVVDPSLYDQVDELAVSVATNIDAADRGGELFTRAQYGRTVCACLP